MYGYTSPILIQIWSIFVPLRLYYPYFWVFDGFDLARCGLDMYIKQWTWTLKFHGNLESLTKCLIYDNSIMQFWQKKYHVSRITNKINTNYITLKEHSNSFSFYFVFCLIPLQILNISKHLNTNSLTFVDYVF